jgi:hypothetical protein
MANTIVQKLKIKEGAVLLSLNAPADFKKNMGALSAGAKIVTAGKTYDQVHWFVLNKSQLEKELDKVLKLLKADTVIWIYYPKGSSKLQTDLNRDKGWETLMSHSDKLTWISLISLMKHGLFSVSGLKQKQIRKKKQSQNPYVKYSTMQIRKQRK